MKKQTVAKIIAIWQQLLRQFEFAYNNVNIDPQLWGLQFVNYNLDVRKSKFTRDFNGCESLLSKKCEADIY